VICSLLYVRLHVLSTHCDLPLVYPVNCVSRCSVESDAVSFPLRLGPSSLGGCMLVPILDEKSEL
jgi:hypothetical protein